jgi:polysaccharide pyruvyl transferase WcaK-like protein
MSLDRILLAGYTADRTNWGCRATSQALRELLAESGATVEVADVKAFRELAWQQHDRFGRLGPFAPFDEDAHDRLPAGTDRPMSAREQRLQVVRGRLEQRFGPTLVPRSVDDFDECAANWMRSRRLDPWLDELQRADLLAINGEGAFRGNVFSGRLLLFLSWFAKERLAKRVAILNHTADFTNPTLRAMAERGYASADVVAPREASSLAQIESLGVARSIVPLPDAAFRWQPRAAPDAAYLSIYPVDASGFDPDTPYVCVGGTAHFQDGLALSPEVIRWYDDLIDGLSDDQQVVLMGHDFPDQELFQSIGRRRDLPVLSCQLPIQSVVDVLGRATTYVGGRWHSSILALAGATPCVPLGTNSKVKSAGLVDLLPYAQPSHEIGRADPAAVVADAARLRAEGDTLRSQLRQHAADHRARLAAVVPLLTDLVA